MSSNTYQHKKLQDILLVSYLAYSGADLLFFRRHFFNLERLKFHLRAKAAFLFAPPGLLHTLTRGKLPMCGGEKSCVRQQGRVKYGEGHSDARNA